MEISESNQTGEFVKAGGGECQNGRVCMGQCVLKIAETMSQFWSRPIDYLRAMRREAL